jgi:hypothetical protein
MAQTLKRWRQERAEKEQAAWRFKLQTFCKSRKEESLAAKVQNPKPNSKLVGAVTTATGVNLIK